MTVMNSNSSKQQGVRLSVIGLHKSCDGNEGLKGIDFEVNLGEIFVIMGPSDSGKSPDISTRYHAAMVFQSGALLTSMTVGENVGFYLTEHHLRSPGEIADIGAKDLEAVGLKGTENKMPEELSGGIRKRVAIARALVVEPQLILYDEPTSGLDPVSSASIAEDILKLNARIHATTLVVSRDRDLAFGIAHRIAVTEEGLIIAIGTPDEIKRNPEPSVQRLLNTSISKQLAAPARLQTLVSVPGHSL